MLDRYQQHITLIISNKSRQTQPMQIIQIKPSTRLHLKPPNTLTTKFTIGNLTLRSVCIYILPLHPHLLSLSTPYLLIDAFQETQLTLTLHISQALNTIFRSKLRVYIWELYDEEALGTVVGRMFGKETDGGCLMFQEIGVQVGVDCGYLRCTNQLVPHSYLVSRAKLPNNEVTPLTQTIKNKVLNHCEKLGKIKAIYTYGDQYIVQFSGLEEIVSSFCEIRDANDRLVIFGIGCVTGFGMALCSPDLLYLPVGAGQGLGSLKGSVKGSAKKEREREEEVKVQARKMIKEEQKKQQQHEKQPEPHLSQFKTQPHPIPHPNPHKKHEPFPAHSQSHAHKKPKDLIKQSFAVGPSQSQQGGYRVQRKRTKSQQFLKQSEQFQFSSTSIDIEVLNSWRNASNFQIKPQKVYEEKTMDVSKKILNIELSHDEKTLYILLRDCLILCDVDFTNKRTIKFDPIDSENIHLPTPMLVLSREKMVIFANQSYIFWVGLTGEDEPDWKYVQRKEIYAIEVIEELNLLMVGGKNFSKLAYLGKSTTRSNIKVYSCGKTGKRDHLFTYDIPNCNGQNVIDLKHITTKPNGTKLLTVLTHQNKLFFLRVRAFNHIEVFSCIETMEIGIQEIISMRYYEESSILVCLEKLSEEALCFKYIKVNCSYEKVEMATESLKMPVVRYTQGFRIGGKVGSEWLTAVDANNCIYSFFLEWKEPEKTAYQSAIKDCLLLERGAIFRENSQVRCRLLKL